MTTNTSPGLRILGKLADADGTGVVRIEDRFDTGIQDLWSALTEPERLARWYGEVAGDLHVGGEYSASLFATGWEGTGRVVACEPPNRFVVVSKDPDEPNEETTEVTLTADGDSTILVMEQRGMPLAMVAGYGAGNQIHIEDLADHIAGRERRTDVRERFEALMPAYREQAAKLDSSDRILGSLGSANGKGMVRIEERYATDIDDLWSAITEPARLARWWGTVDGDLRPGGKFHLVVEWEGSGRVEACEPPRRLRVTIRESDESYRKGQGVPPFDSSIEATLTADGAQTILVIKVQGMPLDKIAFYGTGWQIHAENLAAYLAERERGDIEARWAELVPLYQDLAANIGE